MVQRAWERKGAVVVFVRSIRIKHARAVKVTYAMDPTIGISIGSHIYKHLVPQLYVQKISPGTYTLPSCHPFYHVNIFLMSSSVSRIPYIFFLVYLLYLYVFFGLHIHAGLVGFPLVPSCGRQLAIYL
jgi:hypothetical protein